MIFDGQCAATVFRTEVNAKRIVLELRSVLTVSVPTPCARAPRSRTPCVSPVTTALNRRPLPIRAMLIASSPTNNWRPARLDNVESHTPYNLHVIQWVFIVHTHCNVHGRIQATVATPGSLTRCAVTAFNMIICAARCVPIPANRVPELIRAVDVLPENVPRAALWNSSVYFDMFIPGVS